MKKQHKIFILSFLTITLPVLGLAAGLIPSDAAIKADGFTAFSTMLNSGLKWFISISGTVAAITFSIGGAKILLNPGNDKAITEGKAVLWKTVQGMVIILCAWLFINLIVSTLVTEKSINALRFLK